MDFLPKPRMSNYQRQSVAQQQQKSRVVEKQNVYEKFKAAFNRQSNFNTDKIEQRPCYFCQESMKLRHKMYQQKNNCQVLTQTQCNECTKFICQSCEEFCEMCKQKICKLCSQYVCINTIEVKICQQCIKR